MTGTAPSLPPPSAWQMYRSMVGVGLVCGLLVVTAFVGTAPIIRRNRAEALQRAVLQVLPGASSTRSFRLAEDGHLRPAGATATGDQLVHAAYDDRSRLIGVAVEAQGLGYQDVIRVLYGYAPARDAIVGLHVLDSRDTPGLGDRIETDPEFLRNFEHLDVALSDDGAELAHPIAPVKRGARTASWQVDTITGATISSTAVATMVSRSAAFWVPRIRRELAALEAPE